MNSEKLAFVPEPSATPARHVVEVTESEPSGATFHRLRLASTDVARQARPGQFVHVLPRTAGAGYDPLLRRAFSIMSTSCSVVPGPVTEDGREGWFDILFRVGGRGTQQLARCRAGDQVDLLGPLGNGFAPEGWREHLARPVFLVGGGIGVPPLVFTAQVLAQNAARSVEAFVGARTRGELVGVEALQAAGVQLHIATDDGSQGRRGLVTLALRERLEQSTASGSAPLVCACGPWPMLRAVAEECARVGVECRVSLEESMPCGIGVCNGCVVPVRGAADDYGRFQRICVQGPILDSRAVDWGDPLLAPQGPALAAHADDSDGPEHEGASQ